MADIESEEFNDTCVRGFHVYKDVWRPVIGEELRCQREEDNPRDPYAVAVTKSRTRGGGCRARSPLFINSLFVVYKKCHNPKLVGKTFAFY